MKKILACAMVLLMLASALPLTAFAEETPPVDGGSVATEVPPEESSSVPEESSSVPEESNSVPEESNSVPEESNSVPEESSSVPEESSSAPDEGLEPDAVKIVTAFAALDENGAKITATVGLPQAELMLPTQLMAAVDGAEEWIDSVTWQCDGYDADVAGEYVFTAVLPAGYALDGENPPALPTVTVVLEGDLLSADAVEGDFTYTVLNGTATITGYSGIVADITTPAMLGGCPVVVIGSSAFRNKTMLRSVVVGDSVTEIGSFAFYGCSNLASLTLPNRLARLGSHALVGTAITSIHIPKSLTLPKDITGKYYEDLSFYNCNTLKTVTFETGVTVIPPHMFDNARGLESATLPDTVTKIGNHAFNNCASLAVVTIPGNMTTIGDNAFKDCSSLANITLPNSITDIGLSAFSGCSSLASITLPNQLARLGSFALSDTAITSIHIPKSLTTPYETNGSASGSYPFYDCNTLKTVTFEAGVTVIPPDMFNNARGLESVTIPETVNKICSRAFGGCASLAAITLPNSITDIGVLAFSGCSNLAALTLPNKLARFGNAALSSTAITSIHIPKSLTVPFDKYGNYHGDFPFEGCNALKTVTFEAGVTIIPPHLFYGAGGIESFTIPNTVTKIGGSAFAYCASLTDITIPDSVTTIGDNAFKGCTSLPGITLPDSVIEIDSYALSDCSNLASVTLPNKLSRLGNFAFSGTPITGIHIPKSLTLPYGPYGDYPGTTPFFGCNTLKTVTFEAGVTTIPRSMFHGAHGLEIFTIPDTVTQIGSHAFYSCTSLSNITIPLSVTTIDASAFYGCTSLRSVALPESVSKLGNYVFSGCPNLEQIYIPDTVSSIGLNAFQNSPKTTFWCNEASFAAIYAIENNIALHTLGNTADSANLALSRASCVYTTSLSEMSASGYIALHMEYAFKSSAQASVSDLKLVIRVPANTELVQSSLKLGDTKLTGFTYENNVLTIPVSAKSGTLRFSVKPASYGTFTSYASMSFKWASAAKTEVIGVVNTTLPVLTLVADEETDIAEVPVSGVAVPGKSVSLFVDGALQTTVTASKTGNYAATLTIPNPKNFAAYEITAESTDQAYTFTSAKRMVRYNATTPVLAGFIMQHNGQTFDLSENMGLKPIVTFRGGSDFTFTITFRNADQIEKVYVVSDRANVKKRMEAVWNAQQQAYVAKGFFDPSNHSYVPGVISVEYLKKGVAYSLDDEIDFSGEEFVNTLPVEIGTGTFTVISQTAQQLVAELALNDTAGSVIRLTYTVTDGIPSELTRENAEANGYTLLSDDSVSSGDSLRALGFEEIYGKWLEYSFDTVKSDILDFNSDKYFELIMENKTPGLGRQMSAIDGFTELLGGLEMGKSLVGTYETFDNNRIELKDIKDEILASNRSSQAKEAALKEVETAGKINTHNMVMKYLFTGLTAVGLVASPPLGLMMTAMKMLSDYQLDRAMVDVKGLSSMQSGGASLTFRWAIDPSGYVYDLTNNQRLQGVKATVYYKETSASSAVVWDAAEYGQKNPLYTGDNGAFSWDVPEGLWQVRCEKDGYQNASSAWLTVPPPQLDVKIGMLPEGASATVTSIKITGTPTTLLVGKTAQLGVTILPSYAINKAVTWTSSNTAVATVTSAGVVKGVKAGTATITCTTTDGAKTATCTVYVGANVTGITLSAASKTVRLGSTFTLTPTVSPSTAANKTVTWTTSNAAVATVTTAGTVKGVALGTATITAKTQDGGKLATCVVTVAPAVTSVKLNTSVRTVPVGATYTLVPTVSPSNAAIKTVKWTTSNAAIATVSSTGAVKGVKAGKVIITCTTSDGAKTATCTVYVGPNVTAVKLNATTKSLKLGSSFTLAPTFTPTNAANKTITWTTSNAAVATVSTAGVVKGLKLGTATITAKTQDGGKLATCVVTVGPAVTSVKLNTSVRTVPVGATYTLVPTVSPSNAAIKTVKWTTSNAAIATVSSTGAVKGIKAGKVTITCTTSDGAKTATCTVYVGPNVTALKLNAAAKTLPLGSTFTLAPTFTPTNAANKTVTWTSSNAAVATVSTAGVVKGVALGTATITAKTQDGGKLATCVVTVGPAVTSVKLNTTVRTVPVGASYTLVATVSPSNAAVKTVTWTSSNTTVAIVTSAGVVKGIKAGTATIICKTSNGGKTATCTVYVGPVVTAVKLNATTKTLAAGATYTLVATVSPSTAANKTVAWTSSNTAVATVTSAGVVTAKGPGTATITAKTQDGGKTATCTITVTQPVTGVELDQTTLALNVGGEATLVATVLPTNAANKAVTWSTDEETVATVSTEGVVTAVGPGSAFITVTTKDGGKTAMCTVTVA